MMVIRGGPNEDVVNQRVISELLLAGLDDVVGRPLEPRDFGPTGGVGGYLAGKYLGSSGPCTRHLAWRPERRR